MAVKEFWARMMAGVNDLTEASQAMGKTNLVNQVVQGFTGIRTHRIDNPARYLDPLVTRTDSWT